MADKAGVDRFWQDAVSIFETASTAPSDEWSSDLGIVLDHSGALRIVDAGGWSPEALHAHYGGRISYHVAHRPEGVRVEGNGPGVNCTLRQTQPLIGGHSAASAAGYRVAPRNLLASK